nr:SLAP domain-containing protein [Tumebacillus amylolyticus]
MDVTQKQKGEYSILEIQQFEQFLAKCPPLLIGQFDFQAYEAGPHHGGWFAHVFIRNAVSVGDNLSLQVIPLSLYDALGEKLASHLFELDMQPIKFGEARLHTFYWPGETSLKPSALADLTTFRVDMV